MASASEDSAILGIEKFRGINFHLWKFKMQMILQERDLWGIICGDEDEPTLGNNGVTGAQILKFEKRERKALATNLFISGRRAIVISTFIKIRQGSMAET
eukprot:gene1991-2261_t